MDHSTLHERARRKGVNRAFYWLIRAVFQPFFHVYFRMQRIGREHFPASGPVIIAANHRSFLDPFVIATMVRRPMYYVAKKELFSNRLQSWVLSNLGAFPVDRGAGDADTIRTAKELLERGEIVLIFAEGTRVRPGPLGRPKKGVGRLALETGAPVVPVAVIGTEAVRRGWRIRPHHVRIRAGRPLHFPVVVDPSPEMAAAVTARIWPCVMLQWEWLGGTPAIRRAAVIGAGSWGTGLAVCLARAGFEVDLGCRTGEQADELRRTRVNSCYLPGKELPAEITVMQAEEVELGAHDLVWLAVPARALPDLLTALGDRIPRRAGLLVMSKGLVPPFGTLPSAFASERTHARAVGVVGGASPAAEVLEPGASVVVASVDRMFTRQVADALRLARLDVATSTDVSGVELTGVAWSVARLAAALAAAVGRPNAAATAASQVFGEVGTLARLRGANPETFTVPLGAGDLVATVVSDGSHEVGGSLSPRVRTERIRALIGQFSEAVDTVELLSRLADSAGLQTPAIDSLLAVAQGRMEPARWLTTVTAPEHAGAAVAGPR
jgi:1-acyl-sn-glycerol-3-phosphate acyltransferase